MFSVQSLLSTIKIAFVDDLKKSSCRAHHLPFSTPKEYFQVPPNLQLDQPAMARATVDHPG